jgi:hypothetical protein
MLSKLQEINPKQVQVPAGIVPDPKRTRELHELVNSPRAVHLLDPVLVHALGRQFSLISGIDRLQAATDAGLLRIPAQVFKNLSREDIASFRLAEGQRQGPPPFRLVARELCILRSHLEEALSEGGGTGTQPSHRVLARSSVGLSHTEVGFRLRVSPVIEAVTEEFLRHPQKRQLRRDEFELLPRSVFVRTREWIPTDGFCDEAYERLLRRFLSAYHRDRRGTGFTRPSGKDSASTIRIATEFMLLKAAKEASRVGLPAPAPPTPYGPASRSRWWPCPAAADAIPEAISVAPEDAETLEASEASAPPALLDVTATPPLEEPPEAAAASEATVAAENQETTPAEEDPDVPVAPEELEAAEPPDDSEIPSVTEGPESQEAEEASSTPETSNVPDAQQIPEVQAVKELREGSGSEEIEPMLDSPDPTDAQESMEVAGTHLAAEPGNQISVPNELNGNLVSTPVGLVRHGMMGLLAGIRRAATRVAVWLGAADEEALSQGGRDR